MSILRKFFVGLKRIFQGGSLEYVSEMKRFGNEAEAEFAEEIKRMLPGCKIKTNVMIHIPKDEVDAEIDCLVMYHNNLFAIEIKHWIGCLTANGDSIISEKIDRYTGEIHTKIMRSPFKQVKRAIGLLKKMTRSSAWIEPIVYFSEADEVYISNESAWFDDMIDLVEYIKNYQGKNDGESKKCFERSHSADYVSSHSRFGFRACHCVVEDSGLMFQDGDTIYTRRDIKCINVEHHFSYDDIVVTLRSDEKKVFKKENAHIIVLKDRKKQRYNFSKLDYIQIGK